MLGVCNGQVARVSISLLVLSVELQPDQHCFVYALLNGGKLEVGCDHWYILLVSHACFGPAPGSAYTSAWLLLICLNCLA